MKKFYGTHVKICGDEIPVKENAIVILNHQRMTDIPVLFSLGRAKQRLGDFKWYAKDSIKYFPGVGWGLLFIDCLFIKRNWVTDKNYIHRMFAKILKYKVPCWVINFVEGTRLTEKKLARSQKFAGENGLKPLHHCLIPRTKGFATTIQSLKGHVTAVYDITICYVNGVPTLWQWIAGYARRVTVHVKRFEIKNLPTDHQALSDWLIKRFEEKDMFLDYYYKNGKLPISEEKLAAA